MSERVNDSMEVELSPEQQALIKLARSLTALPQASIHESKIGRPMTRGERVRQSLGRLFGAKTDLRVRGAPHSVLQRQSRGRALLLRKFTDEDARSKNISSHLNYVGGGVISLLQSHETTFPSGVTTEELSLQAIGYASRHIMDEIDPESKPRIETLWSVNLLEPLDDGALREVKAELTQAATQHPEV